jgi:glycosyltransferase involved in cell wall biosynthesis
MMLPASGSRILMTTDAVGGVWIFATGLARALGAAGLQVTLVTLGPRPTPAQRDVLGGAPGISVVETDLKLEWQDPAGLDVGNAAALLHDIAQRFAPDIVHLNGFREANLKWPAPTVLVAHSCVNTWASSCGETACFADEPWNTYSAAVRAALCNADVWVAPTAAFGDQIAQQYGVPRSGHVIWNGIDEIRGKPAARRPVILGAGRVWDKAKNLSALAAIAPGVDWPVRIAGRTEPDQRESSRSGQNCEFTGELAHQALLHEMRHAGIFVSPARYEPFGLSVLEAASSGCALVLSDIATFRELWDGAALFVDPRDPDALRRSVQSVCRDDVQRTRLQRAAAERSRRYPLRQTAAAYRSIYASLLASSGAGARSLTTGVSA